MLKTAPPSLAPPFPLPTEDGNGPSVASAPPTAWVPETAGAGEEDDKAPGETDGVPCTEALDPPP
jgi:hypothetical protein